MDIKEYFARISYRGSYNKPDLPTLSDIFQHHIRAVPFENLSIHCGERIELDLEATYNKIVRKKRGGWCMENNSLLSWVLKTLGYDITLLGANVYVPERNAYPEEINHLLMKVVLDGKSYIVDGGFGIAYQMWQPMELISGADQPQTPGVFRFREEGGIWYFEKVKRKQLILNQDTSTSHKVEDEVCRPIYIFTLQPRDIEEFRGCNALLQTAPDSLFVTKSFCSLQTADGIRALVGWKLTEMKFNYRDNMDLVEIRMLADEEIEKTLQVSPDNILRKKSICSLQTTEGLIALVGWTLTEVKYNYTEDTDLVHITTLTDEELEKTLKDKFNIVLENKLVPVNVRGLPPNLVDKI